MDEMKLDKDQYLAAHNKQCPQCLSPDIKETDRDINADEASRLMYCKSCKFAFHEIYKLALIGYFDDDGDWHEIH